MPATRASRRRSAVVGLIAALAGVLLLTVLGLIFARPIVGFLFARGLPLMEGGRSAAYYAERLRTMLPFAVLALVVYSIVTAVIFHPTGVVARLWPRSPHLQAAMLLTFALALALAPHYLTGDEPHYVVMADSLWRHGTFDLDNEARERGPGAVAHALPSPEGGTYSYHFPGLPVILAAPYGLLGISGAFATMAFAWTALVVLMGHWRLRSIGSSGGDGPLLCAAFCLPLGALSGEIYPEIPAALLVAGALASLELDTAPAAWVVGAACALLPWFHVRLLGPASVLAIAALVRLPRRRALPLLALVASMAVQLALFSRWYGAALPWAMYVGGAPLGNLVRGSLGVLFDQ